MTKLCRTVETLFCQSNIIFSLCHRKQEEPEYERYSDRNISQKRMIYNEHGDEPSENILIREILQSENVLHCSSSPSAGRRINGTERERKRKWLLGFSEPSPSRKKLRILKMEG